MTATTIGKWIRKRTAAGEKMQAPQNGTSATEGEHETAFESL